ncbi:MAG: glycosyltransferase [Thermoleophilaceae bacterium]
MSALEPPPPPPDPRLRACVVVPARDEEERVGACLDALAAQVAIEPPEYEVLLVLDACTDETAERVRAAAARHFELRLYLLDGPGRGSGPARALGMNTACERLHAAGRPSGLIASTDADSRVAPDWLSAQLAASERGARAIGGRIELCARERELLSPRVVEGHAERGRGRHATGARRPPGRPVRRALAVQRRVDGGDGLRLRRGGRSPGRARPRGRAARAGAAHPRGDHRASLGGEGDDFGANRRPRHPRPGPRPGRGLGARVRGPIGRHAQGTRRDHR